MIRSIACDIHTHEILFCDLNSCKPMREKIELHILFVGIITFLIGARIALSEGDLQKKPPQVHKELTRAYVKH